MSDAPKSLELRFLKWSEVKRVSVSPPYADPETGCWMIDTVYEATVPVLDTPSGGAPARFVVKRMVPVENPHRLLPGETVEGRWGEPLEKDPRDEPPFTPEQQQAQINEVKALIEEIEAEIAKNPPPKPQKKSTGVVWPIHFYRHGLVGNKDPGGFEVVCSTGDWHAYCGDASKLPPTVKLDRVTKSRFWIKILCLCHAIWHWWKS